MAISTLNIDTTKVEASSGFVNKSLEPGNHFCRITKIWMEKAKFTNKDNIPEFFLYFNLEGKAQPEGFEGFLIDMNNPSLGRHKGQSGAVATRMFSYKDFTNSKGEFTPRDENILIDLKLLCEALGILPWFTAPAQQVHNTVEDLVAAMNAQLPFKDIWMFYTIAGREYKNKSGYTAYNLFLPLPGVLGKPYSKDESKIQKFFELEHVKKAVAKFATTEPVKAVTPAAQTALVKEMSKEERMEVAQAAMNVPANNPATPISNSFENNQVEEEDAFLKSMNEPINNDIIRGNSEEPEFIL